jgi:ribose transport system substrate-binding protein
VFAANNTSGNGAARAIKDNHAADRIPVVAFDTDPQENAALADGSIDAWWSRTRTSSATRA